MSSTNSGQYSSLQAALLLLFSQPSVVDDRHSSEIGHCAKNMAQSSNSNGSGQLSCSFLVFSMGVSSYYLIYGVEQSRVEYNGRAE